MDGLVLRAGLIDFLSSLLERCATSHRRALLLVAAFALACFLPGFASLQPMDRDEPRFAQASKQMLESGDFVSISFQQEARNKKPAGIYWAQAATVAAAEGMGFAQARTTIWLYRLPSLVAAVAAALLTYWAALAFLARPHALLAALALASTVLVGVEARLAKTDAAVLATVVAAMGAFARIYLRRAPPSDWLNPTIFWGAVGVGLLVKGPITPMIPLLAGLALAVRDRGAPWLSGLRPLAGTAFALAIAAPWFLAIMIETQGAFIVDSLGRDMLGKVAGAQESHGAPPLAYFAAFWALAWPVSPLAALAAPTAFAARRQDETAFLLAWLAPAWIVFELTPTKLPHYVLPLYPAIMILLARAIAAGALNEPSGWRQAVLWLTPLIVTVAALGAGGYALARLDAPSPDFFLFAPLAVAAAILFAAARASAQARVALACMAAALFYPAAYVGLLTAPAGKVVALSPRLAAALDPAAAASGCARFSIATAGYNEPSLVFLVGTDTRVALDGARAAAFAAEAPCRAAVVDARHESAFLAALPAGAPVTLTARVRGVNINGGRKLDLGLWVHGEPPR